MYIYKAWRLYRINIFFDSIYIENNFIIIGFILLTERLDDLILSTSL